MGRELAYLSALEQTTPAPCAGWNHLLRPHEKCLSVEFPNSYGTPPHHLCAVLRPLQYLRKTPASGYFPRRSIEPEVKAGWVRVIKDAPRFAYAAYAVFSESQIDGVAGQAAQLMRRFARESLNVSAETEET